MRFIEAVPDLIVVIPPPSISGGAFGFEELPTARGGKLSVLDGTVEVDDMGVRVREQCPLRREVEADAPESINGSTQTVWASSEAYCEIQGTSFVLMPCVLIGGT